MATTMPAPVAETWSESAPSAPPASLHAWLGQQKQQQQEQAAPLPPAHTFRSMGSNSSLGEPGSMRTTGSLKVPLSVALMICIGNLSIYSSEHLPQIDIADCRKVVRQVLAMISIAYQA